MKPIGTSILNLGRFLALPLAGLTLAAPATAQEASASMQSASLEEIVVVAQKREQNIMDVPVAITAVTGAQIEASGIKDMIDLQQNVPGLIVSGSQTTTTSNFSIRGIGSTSNNFGVESSVGLYVDGVYRSRQSSLINELVDVEAVEVLRGPQGTLFGKNTAAGAIQVRTVAPSTESYDGFLDVTMGSLDLRRVSGAVNIPLTDNLAFRGTVFSSQRDGYVDNLIYDLSGPVPSTTAQEDLFNNRDRFGFRLQVGYDNGEDFNLRVIADYSEIDEICCIGTSRVDGLLSHGLLESTGVGLPGPDFLRLNLGNIVFTDYPYPSVLPTAALLGFDVPLPPTVIQGVSWDDYVTSVNFAPISQNEDRGISVEFNKDFENTTFTSVSAYRAFDTYDLIDVDFTDTTLGERENTAQQTSFSQEFRLAGTFGESSNWVVGAYYFAQEIKSNTVTVGGAQLQAFADLGEQFSGSPFTLTDITNAVTGISIATNGLIPVGAQAFPEGAFANDNVTQDHDGYAVFGQVDWALSDAVTLTLGARFTDETKDIDAVYTQTNPGTNPPDFAAIGATLVGFQEFLAGNIPAPPDPTPLLAVAQPNEFWGGWTLPPFSPRPNVQDTLEDDQITGTAKVTWFANDSTMMYLSYATGYKAGGTNADRIFYDAADPDNPLFSQLFDAEKSTSIELGYKGDIGDNIRLSASVYQTDFDDFQANTFEGSGFVLRNAGDLEIKGVELEWIWQVMENTSVTGYFAHNEGEYITFPNAVAWDATPFHSPGVTDDGDRSGESLPYNPEDRFQISLTQNFPMGANNLFFRADYAWASETATDGDNDPLTVQDDFGILNLRVGMDLDDWNSTITLWGRNVTDERYYNGSFDPPLLDFGRMNSYPSEVATYGITFRKNWD
ncbi:MAG: TonB-dependent receptor [Woeseiaceae bacterium]|nr:TonB-dependent receptor [Woeseiaceae bacterium]